MKRYTYITPDDYLIAKSNGIGKSTLETRVHSLGWDIDTAISHPVGVPRRKSRIPKELRALAESNGVPLSALRNRIYELNWDGHKAATVPVAKQNKNRSEGYTKWLQVAKKNGISKNTYYFRVVKAGWSYKRAATEPLMEVGKYDRSKMKARKAQ